MRRGRNRPRWWVWLLPPALFVAGVLYARAQEGFVGLGVAVMTVIASAGLLCGVLGWWLTGRMWWGLIAGVVGTGSIWLLIIGSARA